MRGGLLLVSVPLACLALAGCTATKHLEGSAPSLAAQTPPSSLPDSKVDDVTRGILMAAGLDPADPTKPREIRRQVAAVVQVRHQGRTYGTTLARPTPGKIAFVDPMAVANLLGAPGSRAVLAKALKGSIVDVASRDCRVNGRVDRKLRKAFKIPKVCPAASGSVWADFDRRGMAVELHMAPQIAALVQSAPAAPAGLAAPTLFVAEANTKVAAIEPATAPAEPAKPPRAGVNLLSPKSIVAVAQSEPAQPAAAPISLTAPVVLPPLRTVTAANEPSPWSPLLAPASSSTARLETPVARTAPPVASADVTPAVAVVADPGALQPAVLSRGGVSETDEAYTPRSSGGTIRVVPGSYSPMGTTRFFQTKY